MTIGLTPEHAAPADSVAKFCARHSPLSSTRAEFTDIAAGIWPTSWTALEAQGLLALHLPGDAGGEDAGLELATVEVQLNVIAERLLGMPRE